MPRKKETEAHRKRRLEENSEQARRRIDESEDALDEMVKRSIRDEGA